MSRLQTTAAIVALLFVLSPGACLALCAPEAEGHEASRAADDHGCGGHGEVTEPVEEPGGATTPDVAAGPASSSGCNSCSLDGALFIDEEVSTSLALALGVVAVALVDPWTSAGTPWQPTGLAPRPARAPPISVFLRTRTLLI